MRKILIALAMISIASPAMADVVGSLHDLSGGYGGATTTEDQVCKFCHAPHWTNIGVTAVPLWNRTNPTTTGYTYYTSNTLSQAITAVGANSLTCLSCHDGSISVGQIYDNGNNTELLSAATNIGTGTGSNPDADVGTDFRNDHPVGIPYPTSGTDFTAIASVTLPLYGTSDTVECASCHDPHLQTNTPFLRVDNANSALCTACHIK